MFKPLALAAVAALAAGPVLAEEWPTRSVTITVGFGPGSTPDLMARLVAEALQERLGQPFVVENRPGAGGNIALNEVAQAEPDGHTLGVTIPGPLVVNPMTMELMYDPEEDIRPVTILGTQPSVLVVGAELEVESLEALIELLRENPGEYNYASIGVGSISHLAMEMVAMESGTELVHIPYPSSPEAVQSVVGGETHMAALPPLAVIPQAQEGGVIMLAQSAPERMQELGLEDVQAEAWMALVATGGTPDEVVDRLYETVREILDIGAVREQMATMGMEPVGMEPAAFEARLEEERERWREVVTAAGLLQE
jgi:tripartite-type tricarboxylate transporter receptor subunit TctC